MSARKRDDVRPLTTALGLCILTVLAIFCAVASILGVKLANAPTLDWEPLLPILVFLLGVPLTLLWLRLTGWRGDAGLLGAVFMLCGIGLVVQFRMGSFAHGLAKPAMLLPFPLGLVAFWAGAALTGKSRGVWLASLRWPAWIAALTVLLLMLVLGRSYRGGVYLPGNMNPSEIVKPLLVIFLAAWLSRRQKAFSETQAGIPVPPLSELLGLALLWGIPMLLIIALKDLGLMMLLNAILIIMLFAVARTTGYLAIGLAAVTAAGFGVQFLSAHARARFDVWLHPFADPTGKGWQILQALAAMYSGGLWGAGLGAGVPHSVPIVTSDFIYAAVAEEIGLAGCALLLLMYAVLFSRGLRVAGAARTPFERLLGIGLTASLATQTILNVAGVTKALPMTGITLPLISHGGSSLITTLLIAGMLAGLSDRK